MVYPLIFRPSNCVSSGKTCGYLLIFWRHLLSSNSSSFFQFAVVVICCDVTSLFFIFVCKPFTMDEELYQYKLCSPHLPDSLPGTFVLYTTDEDLRMKTSCIRLFLLWSAPVTPTIIVLRMVCLQEALCCSRCQHLSCSWCNTNGHQPLLWGGACVRARWQERLQAVNKAES